MNWPYRSSPSSPSSMSMAKYILVDDLLVKNGALLCNFGLV